MTKKNTLIIISGLLLSNLLTGYFVYKVQGKAYLELQGKITSILEKNIRMNNELDAYHLACPDFVYEE